jgi:hypothetical protein
MDINEIIAKNLRAAMLEKFGEVNQTRFAELSGLAQPGIGLLLNPDRRLPALNQKKGTSATVIQLVMVARALDIEPWELIHPNIDEVKRQIKLAKAVGEFKIHQI